MGGALPSHGPHVAEGLVRLSGYVELSARTQFSFLRGAGTPDELVLRAKSLGYGAVAVCDVDGLYGMVRADMSAKREGLRLIVGCELSVQVAFGALTLHVQNHEGYTHLCELLTEAHKDRRVAAPRADASEARPRNARASVDLAFVCARAAGLWAMVPSSPAPTSAQLQMLRAAFGERLSLSVVRHKDGHDAARTHSAQQLSAEFGVAVCATNGVRYPERSFKPVFDVLHCIREGQTLERAGRALAPNAEAHLKSASDMRALFADMPAWCDRSVQIARACTFAMSELRYLFPFDTGDDLTVSGEGSDARLARLSELGMRTRYGDAVPFSVREQVAREIALIEKLQLAPYFLCVREIVEIARAKDILCQGRGSAANSAVCFCLGITSVDPATSNLLFERFLSAERSEPPDIDVDFEHDRREEVIQAIYERYGRDRAAMVSNLICYRGKSALREVAKVFGFEPAKVDALVRSAGAWGALREVDPKRLESEGLSANDLKVMQVLASAKAIQGYPRHLSIHVGGFVLSAEPLTRIAPIEPAAMTGRTVIPWDKDDLDALGFFKVDVLALGMLSALRRGLSYIRTRDDAEAGSAATAIDQLALIPNDDAAVFDAFERADTVGVFQVESRAQMSMLPRLRPRCFYDLVVQVALVRPGPIQGGAVHPYLARRAGKEPITLPHPILEPVLGRTFGVPIFQEQVMQLAIIGAGYTGSEADQLRRDMAAWKRTGNLKRHRDKLAAGFAERGISAEFAEQLYKQIHGFAEYGFPESHAASFARLVYASGWIKAHYPAEFAAALVNSQPMGFYSVSTLLRDAQHHGVEVRSACIGVSDWDCTFERDHLGQRAIRVGLRVVRGLGKATADRILVARAECKFSSIEDMAARANLNRKELDVLARAGALQSLAPERRVAIWRARSPQPERGTLFEGLSMDASEVVLPSMHRFRQLVLDYASTGLSVSDHPMLALRDRLPAWFSSSADLKRVPHGAEVSVGGLVLVRQRPATASGVVFMTLEDEHGFVNLVLYARVFERLRHVSMHKSLVAAHGRLQSQEGILHLVVERLEPLTRGGFPSASRDFH